MPDSNLPRPFTAVVLAGDRGQGDPLARQAGACCKAMVEVEGTPMLLRVLRTLDNASRVSTRLISGPGREQLENHPLLNNLITEQAVEWHAPRPTPSTSAFHVMQTIPDESPVLVTTADHPLLTTTMVDEFCTRSQGRNSDVTVGLAPYEIVKQAYPDMKKTVLHFRNGNYCGTNLFTFLTARGRHLADFWRRVESQRKNPLRIIRILGWGAVIRYLLGMLTLDTALELLSRRLNLRISAVILPYADAAVDIDSIADHAIVSKKLADK